MNNQQQRDEIVRQTEAFGLIIEGYEVDRGKPYINLEFETNAVETANNLRGCNAKEMEGLRYAAEQFTKGNEEDFIRTMQRIVLDRLLSYS